MSYIRQNDTEGLNLALDAEDVELLRQAEANPDALVTDTPPSQNLKTFSVICLIVNRMIGTGIFSTPFIIIQGTNSVAVSIILWVLGALFSAIGLSLYLELGLSIPKYHLRGSLDDRPVSVPRSGAEKNYLEYIYKKPKYLATCVYGVIFICLGNTAGNAISFGKHFLTVLDVDSPDPGLIRGVAIAAITLACLLHGLWRAGGIYVNNTLATVKVGILLIIIACGLVAYSGAFPEVETNVFKSGEIFDGSTSIGYAEAMIAVVFSYGGFNNAHYVLSEVDRPQRTLKRGAFWALGIVSFLYILTNIAYFGVLSKSDVMGASEEVAAEFFRRIFGSENVAAARVPPAFIALSSLGNIVVVTFVAARVKQEIAKEGVLPFSRWFAANTATLPTRFFGRRRRPTEPEDPATISESTPVAALFLHWIFSMIMVTAPPIGDAYPLFVNLYSYTIYIWIGFLISAGLLWLRYKPHSTWVAESTFKPWGGPTMPIIFLVVNAFLIVAPFIPVQRDQQLSMKSIPWFVFPTIGTGLFLLGGVYWGLFAHVWPRLYKLELKVQRIPILVDRVQVHEVVVCSWVVPGGMEDGKAKEFEMESPTNEYIRSPVTAHMYSS